MSRIRTFVAVEVAPPVIKRAQHIIERLRASGPNVKWVDTRKLHITLNFLGDVEEQSINDVCVAVRDAVASLAPFEFETAGVGAFPRIEHPRTIWLGIETGSDELCALQNATEKALTKLRFPKENRKYTPHLTLGRLRRSGPDADRLAEELVKHTDFQAGQTAADEVVVYSSRLSRDGPVYEALARAPLGTNLR